jgi:protein TonB
MSRRCTTLGFTVSSVVHMGVAAAVLTFGLHRVSVPIPPEQPVPLALAMFSAPSTQALAAEPPTLEPEPMLRAQPPPRLEPKAVPPKVAKPRERAAPKPVRAKGSQPKRLVKAEPGRTPTSMRRAEPALHAPVTSPWPGQTMETSARPPRARPPARAVAKTPSASVAERYKRALLQAIHRHKHYPRQARRKGEEGRVQVAFTVERDGTIRDVRVVAGSGAQLLDRAAEAAVKSIGRFQPFPQELGHRSLRFQVPIVFALL